MWLYSVLMTSPRLLWPYIRLRGVGLENVPARGPVIVASNHASFIDPWLIGCVFPLQPVRFLVTARWYDTSRFWRWFFDGHHCIAAALEDPVETIGRAVEGLREGATIGIFPEGRISHDGRMQRGRVGLGWAAALSGAPVVPAALHGSYAVLPRSRRLPRPGRIELRIGAPRVFPASANPDAVAVRDFVGDVMEDLCRLSGQTDRIDAVRPRVAVDLGASLTGWLERRKAGADGTGRSSQ
ncbi:MAG: 1-acyl-sn-glycerol-3-phosphate acyltransferase [Acidobacteria bacterium]|jgi:1-acyl-sn-glycerol-3-phosphate acyltransferase|nr:1-acyl-sn-glycerol-3-phosphate acyltransferase [Acidobacteriota bacterium]MCU0253901.1 1-acyl-sn-glycerol-3-phosphate acyltransferase [Acidobacteriota bacterium]